MKPCHQYVLCLLHLILSFFPVSHAQPLDSSLRSDDASSLQHTTQDLDQIASGLRRIDNQTLFNLLSGDALAKEPRNVSSLIQFLNGIAGNASSSNPFPNSNSSTLVTVSLPDPKFIQGYPLTVKYYQYTPPTEAWLDTFLFAERTAAKAVLDQQAPGATGNEPYPHPRWRYTEASPTTFGFQITKTKPTMSWFEFTQTAYSLGAWVIPVGGMGSRVPSCRLIAYPRFQQSRPETEIARGQFVVKGMPPATEGWSDPSRTY